MNPRDLRIASAILESPVSGTLELNGDWTGRGLPRFLLAEAPHAFHAVQQVPEHEYAFDSGFYATRRGQLHFVFDPARYPDFSWRNTPVYVAGGFNGWQEAVGKEEWQLE